MIKAISIFVLIGIAGALLHSPEARGKTTVAQNWIGAWNSADPEKLVAAFTPDAVYEDVAFGIIRRAARSYATCTNSSTTPYQASMSSSSTATLQTVMAPSSGFSAAPT
jgi:hypothetical protein